MVCMCVCVCGTGGWGAGCVCGIYGAEAIGGLGVGRRCNGAFGSGRGLWADLSCLPSPPASWQRRQNSLRV